MKKIVRPRALRLLCLALGGLGLVLKKLLYALAVDDRGLLVPNHPTIVALALVTAAALALIVSQVYRRKDPSPVPPGRRVPLLAAAGCFFNAAGIVLTVALIPPLTPGYPAVAWKVLGVAAGIGQLVVGYARLNGRKPPFFLHLLVSLFFIFHIVDHYRAWSGDPQLMDFLFSLLSAAALTLFAFYCAADAVGLGRSRMRLGMGLAALYFSVAELASTDFFLLYVSSIAWVYTTLMIPGQPPDPAPRRKGADAHGAA